MAKLTAQEKAKAKEVQEIEARLRASANSATHVVDGWLGSSSEDEDNAPVKARSVFQGRPARVGIGAKFLSHKEMQQRSTRAIEGVDPLTPDELALKRKLTRHTNPQNSLNRSDAMADVQGDDESDSRSQMVSKSKRIGPDHTATNGSSKKKKSKSSAFLDSLIQQRRRR
ncbi:hypothetical protein IW137_001778 [Coemansia sp. RSA 1287]|nr:hypothetical protein GGF47_002501 [Coemansia sp. RSA 2524]KAJ2445405.1 hypothetical protein IWW46_001508 [Coemansia sp. RSA 2440]KAJ2585387.1 hypothetical protein IWW49_004631 [Coemansia sp. RSA 1797]KAJ2645572.1 hypothetical protein IW137_001778 [Coemansia sp. RSA 1287]